MDIDNLKQISQQSYDMALQKANALKKADSDQIVVYENHILAFKKQYGIILSRDNFHHVNLCARDEGATRLVSNLVRLDRLPGVNPPEGMRFLRTAWRHYDIALHLAWKYKLIGDQFLGSSEAYVI